jgi:lysozyme
VILLNGVGRLTVAAGVARALHAPDCYRTDVIDIETTARFVAGFEGFVNHVYKDAVGVETLGYGETKRDVIEQYRGRTITESEALDMLKRRVQEFADGVERCCTNRSALSPERHAALTSLAYNIGIGAFRGSTVCQRFNAGDMDGVPEAMSWWNKGDGRVLEGLTRRRAAEAALFRGAKPAPESGSGGGGVGGPQGDGGPPANGPEVPPWPGRLLRSGVDGDDVRVAQRRLKERGWRIAVDGSFGPKTDTVIRKFQTEKTLAVDGVVGPTTWQTLWTAPTT